MPEASFYIDDLLKSNDCYILELGGVVIGRAPINEDFTISSTYTWQQQDIRSIVDLFKDAMRQTFKNARQIQGHLQSIVAAFTGNAKLQSDAYANISSGKAPLDTSYLTIPVLTHTKAEYSIPEMKFLFFNKDDSGQHIKDAENFLWEVSAVAVDKVKRSEEVKDKKGKVVKDKNGNIVTQDYEIRTYKTPRPGGKPGYYYKKSETSQPETANGFTIVKGNIRLTELSLQKIDVSFSKELNLKGYPQAIRISLTYQDTQRRYPADSIELLRTVRGASALAETKRRIPKQKPKEKKSTNSNTANASSTGKNI